MMAWRAELKPRVFLTGVKNRFSFTYKSQTSLSDQLVRMDYTEVIIDQRFHRHLIGKNGANSE